MLEAGELAVEDEEVLQHSFPRRYVLLSLLIAGHDRWPAAAVRRHLVSSSCLLGTRRWHRNAASWQAKRKEHRFDEAPWCYRLRMRSRTSEQARQELHLQPDTRGVGGAHHTALSASRLPSSLLSRNAGLAAACPLHQAAEFLGASRFFGPG